MTTMLDAEHCVACHKGAPHVTAAEIAELSPQIPQWKIETVKEELRLTRTFRFEDWASTMAFVDRIAALAAEQDHHPRMIVSWGRVTVEWWTHAIGGLHRNDFVMAAKTDAAYGQG